MPTPSSPLRLVITDDDPASRQLLESHIAQTPGLTLVATLADGMQLLEFLRTAEPVDVLLLDVQMPLLSGLDVLRLLPQPPAVILTTSRADFAVEAFALNVVDYLVKPVAYVRFLQAIAKVQRGQSAELPTSAPAPVGAPAAQSASLFVKNAGRLVRLELIDILYVEAAGQFAVIVTKNQQYSTNQTMSELAVRLPDQQFVRIHRSYIINRQHIEVVEEGDVILSGGRRLPIGRTYMADFMAGLNPPS